MPRLVLLLVFVLSVSVIIAPFAGRVAARDLLPSIQQIADRGILRIAIIDGERPPMIDRDVDGNLGGFDVELGNDIARALGVRPQFVAAGAGDREVVDLVATGGADIGLSYLSESVELAKRVIFSAPYMIESYAVLLDRAEALKSFEDCPSVSDLRRFAREGGRVGTLSSGPYAALIHRGSNAPMPGQYDSPDAQLDALRSGEIVASIQGELTAKYFLSRNPEAALRLQVCDLPRRRHRVAAVVGPQSGDLARWLDVYIAQRGIIIDLDTLIYRKARGIY